MSGLTCPKCKGHDVTKNGGRRGICGDCSYAGMLKFFGAEPPADAESQIALLQRRVAGLQDQNKALAKESQLVAAARSVIGKIAARVDDAPPAWVSKPPPKSAKVVHGIPTLMLSDLHFGQTVFESQVNGVNAYSTEIARARVQRVVEGAVKLLRTTLSPGHFGGMVVVLGGDMVDGVIHDELRDTADETVMQSVITLHDTLVPHLKFLCDEFGRLHVPCVAGNHGRLDRKPRAKNRAFLNFDWLLYQLIARTIGADPKYRNKISFQIPDGPDARYRVHNHTYLLTHGDKFTGGNGITGPLLPWMRGDLKTRKQYGAMGQSYSTLLMGHWHQLRYLEGIIVNGTTVGMDEYALRMGFGYETPEQALWLTHPVHGITIKLGVHADEPRQPVEAGSDWVEVSVCT